MAIKVGSSSLSKAYFGQTEISKIILNGVTLYESAPQLDAPTNVSVSGTEVSFDEVANAESYDILVDGNSIGEYTPQSGYTVTITADGEDMPFTAGEENFFLNGVATALEIGTNTFQNVTSVEFGTSGNVTTYIVSNATGSFSNGEQNSPFTITQDSTGTVEFYG